MKAVIYTRVSTTEQVENHSLETQEKFCLAYCAKNGVEVAKIFREEGESAKTVERTQLQLMLQYLTDYPGEIELLVIYRLDRLSRSVSDHHALKALLQSRGIEVRAVLETFDDSPAGKLTENMIAAIAQFEDGFEIRAVHETFDDSPAGRLIENIIAAIAQFDEKLKEARSGGAVA